MKSQLHNLYYSVLFTNSDKFLIFLLLPLIFPFLCGSPSNSASSSTLPSNVGHLATRPLHLSTCSQSPSSTSISCHTLPSSQTYPTLISVFLLLLYSQLHVENFLKNSIFIHSLLLTCGTSKFLLAHSWSYCSFKC